MLHDSFTQYNFSKSFLALKRLGECEQICFPWCHDNISWSAYTCPTCCARHFQSIFKSHVSSFLTNCTLCVQLRINHGRYYSVSVHRRIANWRWTCVFECLYFSYQCAFVMLQQKMLTWSREILWYLCAGPKANHQRNATVEQPRHITCILSAPFHIWRHI